jgi:hypothetical protein
LELGQIVTLKRDLSAAEAITVVSGGALVFSVIYNFGFFSAVHTSFTALLSVQDLVIGAATAFIPTALLMEAAFRFNRWVSGGEGMRRLYFSIFLFAVIFGGGFAVAFVFNVKEATSFLTVMSVSIFAVGIIADILAKRPIGLYIFAFSAVWNVIYTSGQVAFQLSIYSYKSPKFEVVADGKVLLGDILRETSNYTFVYDGTSVTMVPNDKVTSIKKLKVEA